MAFPVWWFFATECRFDQGCLEALVAAIDIDGGFCALGTAAEEAFPPSRDESEPGSLQCSAQGTKSQTIVPRCQTSTQSCPHPADWKGRNGCKERTL